MTDDQAQLRVPMERSFIGMLGLEIDPPAEIGRLTARLAYRDELCQPMGIFHGGVYASVSETLASMGTANAVIADGRIPLGMSNNTVFLRPLSEGTLHAVATAFHRGRMSWLWDVEMRDDQGRLCSTSRVTIAVR